MENSSIYISIAIIAFILIFLGLFIFRKNKEKLSNLLNAALIMIVFSMFFDERIIAYPLIGLGIVLVIIDAWIKLKKKR